MDKLQAMTTFVRIVEAGSLTRASEALATSLPSVVRSLAALEREVRAAEADLLAQLATLLDGDCAAPALADDRVRALMFIQRFRADVTERLDALKN